MAEWRSSTAMKMKMKMGATLETISCGKYCP